jgi:hypothetical protein
MHPRSYSTTGSTRADEFGRLRPTVLRDWATWDERFGSCTPLDVRRAFDATLVERARTG